MIHIGLIEDDPLLRANFKIFFESDPDCKIDFLAISTEQVIANCTYKAMNPFIIFLDLGLPGISGINSISVISQLFPQSNIVVINSDTDEETIWQCITNGAKNYISKPFAFKEIKEQIVHMKEGGVLLSPPIAKILITRLNTLNGKEQQLEPENKLIDIYKLTTRERDVLDYLLKGFTYKEISVALSISFHTANEYIKKVYKKFKVNSKSELMIKLLK